MKKLLIALGIIIVLLGGAYIALITLLSPERIKTTVLPTISDVIGREVRVDGDISIRLFPTFGLKLEQLVVANPKNAPKGSAQLLTVDETTLAVAVMPLFKRELEIKEFILNQPTIALNGYADGTNNWSFSTLETAPAAAAPTAEATTSSELPLADVRIGTIAVRDGIMTYNDRITGSKFALQKANFELQMPTLNSTAVVDGSAFMDGQKLKGRIKLETPYGLLHNEAAKLNVDATTPYADIVADAELTYSTSTPPVFGIKLNQLGIARPGLNTVGFGNANIILGSTRPEITANFTFNHVEITEAPATAGAAPATTTKVEPLQWPTDKIDFSSLGSADAQVALKVEQIKTPAGSIGPLNMDVNLVNSRLGISVKRFDMFDGKLTTDVVLNARAMPATATIKTSLTGLQIQRALPEYAKPYGISGVLGLGTDLTTKGQNVKDFMQNMSGTADLSTVRVGATSFDLAETTNRHFGGLAPFIQKHVSEKTVEAIRQNVNDMAASVFFKNGQGQTVIKFAGPVLAQGGEGTLNLPAADISLRMNPLLKANEQRDIVLPFYIEGPLNAPEYKADQDGITREVARQAARVGAEKLLKKALKSDDKTLGKIGGFLNAVTNRQADEAAPAEGTSEQDAAPQEDPVKDLKKAFGGLFGK